MMETVSPAKISWKKLLARGKEQISAKLEHDQLSTVLDEKVYYN